MWTFRQVACLGALWVALAPATTTAACPAELAVVQDAVSSAAQSFEVFDWTRFDVQVAAARQAVSCVSGPVGVDVAASFYLTEALAAARSRDEAAAVLAFRALLRAQPAFEPRTELIAPGSMLSRALATARLAPDDITRPTPGKGWSVDGWPDVEQVPTDRLAIVQRGEPAGPNEVWVLRGGPLPADLEAALAVAPVVVATVQTPVATPPNPKPRPEPPRGRALLLSGVGAGLASAATLLLVSLPTHAAYVDETNPSEAARLVGLNHLSVIGAGGLGLAASGLVVSAVIVRSF